MADNKLTPLFDGHEEVRSGRYVVLTEAERKHLESRNFIRQCSRCSACHPFRSGGGTWEAIEEALDKFEEPEPIEPEKPKKNTHAWMGPARNSDGTFAKKGVRRP